MLCPRSTQAAFSRLAVLLAVLLTVSPAYAQGITGTWELDVEGGRGVQSLVLELVHAGESLTGTVNVPAGGRGSGSPQELAVQDGVVDGSGFRLSYTQAFRGSGVALSLVGTIDGDSMEGTIEGGRGGARSFTGRRVEHRDGGQAALQLS